MPWPSPDLYPGPNVYPGFPRPPEPPKPTPTGARSQEREYVLGSWWHQITTTVGRKG
jgi:hypothetical protein